MEHWGGCLVQEASEEKEHSERAKGKSLLPGVKKKEAQAEWKEYNQAYFMPLTTSRRMATMLSASRTAEALYWSTSSRLPRSI